MTLARMWMPSEDKYLRDNWQSMTREDMGKHLNRSKDAVTKRGRMMLGLGNASMKHVRLAQGSPDK
jgi:hypothetical protein